MNINKVTIIGAGTMGAGIASWFATLGIETYLCDLNEEVAKDSISGIYAKWDKLVAKGKFEETKVREYKNCLKSTSICPTDSDLVIEAIFENAQVKQKLFISLIDQLKDGAILASNTSSIPIKILAEVLPKDRKKKFLGLHFFNPAPIMKLVEIIPGPETDSNLPMDLYKWFESKGKVPAKCKDVPGFIVNRIARNFYGESFRIVKDHNLEKIQELDEVMKHVGGFKMGPFELMDLIGIDVNLDVTRSVWNAYNKEPRFAPHSLQESMVEKGLLGKKTQKGFYEYE